MPTPEQELILVLNSGSSSLKFGLFKPDGEDETPLLEGSADGIGRDSGEVHLRSAEGEVLLQEEHILESQEQAFTRLVDAFQKQISSAPVAIGHRIVHGGPHLREHQLITPDVEAQLEAAVHFAPLHIPSALSLYRQAKQAFSQVPQFACFDTAFHRAMPPVASHLPLPGNLFDEGVMRYGFHGLSYESIVHRLGSAVPARAVFAHLGNGASVTAVCNGSSMDTSMGLTPTGGVPMGTRTGDLDPGVVLYLMRNKHLDADALEQLLNKQCGLKGLSGGESDMKALLDKAASGDASAALAVNVFCTGICKQIGAYAALLGGLDLLVFTGGIGEHSAAVRSKICERLSFLGIDSPDTGKVQVLPAQEELQIARHCRALLTQGK